MKTISECYVQYSLYNELTVYCDATGEPVCELDAGEYGVLSDDNGIKLSESLAELMKIKC